MTSQDLPHPDAESVFAAWLSQPEPDDFEALCRTHPGLAERLRELRAQFRQVEGALRQQDIGGSLAKRLKSQYGGDVDPQVTLSLEGGAAPSSAPGRSSAEVLSRLSGRGPASTRYKLEGEIAHGGMGAILGVWDEDLRRHLAMKVMLGKGATEGTGETPPVDPKMLSRFLEEAQVTGQLDHPNNVPIHELGLDHEGRVFFKKNGGQAHESPPGPARC